MPHFRRAEAAPLLLVATLVALFTYLAVDVSYTHGPLEIDRQIVALIAPFRGSRADVPMKVATYLCSWQAIVAGTIVALLALVVRRQWRIAILLLVAVVGDQVIVSTLKALIQRPRPDQLLAILPATGSSFPSGHTFICIAFYGMLAGLIARRMRSSSLKSLILAIAVIWV